MKKLLKKLITVTSFFLVTTAASAQQAGKETSMKQIESKNRVAVIPFQYWAYGNKGKKEDMGVYLQEIATDYLGKSAVELKLMDITVVNAILLKSGISDTGIRKYTAKELAALLHTEYIIMGTVMQDNGNVITNSTLSKTRNENRDRGEGYERREWAHQQAVTSQVVETHLTLSIYNEAGEKIYGKTSRSILSNRDAYKNTIHYLLKRTPLYKK